MEQKNIDRRINYRLVIDTETCPIDRSMNGVQPTNMWAYDIGWAIVDRNGYVYKTQSFINADIFCEEKIAMTSAYYANKIPKYEEDIRNGKRTLATFATIYKAIMEDIRLYNVSEVYGHNMRFDYGTLNTTQRWITKSKYRYFFPKQVTIYDTLKMARQVIAIKPTYKKFCEENGYLTKKGQVRLTAEIIYRFISKNQEFNEEHTGLEDVLIEKEILAYCYRQHKKMNGKLWD